MILLIDELIVICPCDSDHHAEEKEEVWQTGQNDGRGAYGIPGTAAAGRGGDEEEEGGCTG